MTRQEMTRQEIFDKAVAVVAERGFTTAMDNGNCRYRSDIGPCLVGALIPDDLYNPIIEGRPVLDDMVFSLIPGIPDTDDMRTFLKELQYCHDAAETPDEMRARLYDFALHNDLKLPEMLR